MPCSKGYKKTKRGRCVPDVKLKKGSLSEFGYKTTLTDRTRRMYLKKAIEKHGALSVFRKLNFLATLNKKKPAMYNLYIGDRDYVKQSLGKSPKKTRKPRKPSKRSKVTRRVTSKKRGKLADLKGKPLPRLPSRRKPVPISVRRKPLPKTPLRNLRKFRLGPSSFWEWLNN